MSLSHFCGFSGFSKKEASNKGYRFSRGGGKIDLEVGN